MSCILSIGVLQLQVVLQMKEYKDFFFYCNLEKVKSHQLNLFTGFIHFDELTDCDIDLSPVLEHLKTLTDYNNDNYEYIFN